MTDQKNKPSHANNTLQQQLEYYMSDENLTSDEFFQSKIKEDLDGFVPVDVFLNCNKIKKLSSSKEDVIEAAKKSEKIEVNKDNSKIRRKGNPPLPELKLLGKKRKNENGDNLEKREKKQKAEKGKNDQFAEEEQLEATILVIKADKETSISWKEIFNKFKTEHPELNVVYFRFDKNEGNAGIFKKTEDIKFKDTLVIGDTTFKIHIAEGKEVNDFWKNHGSHFELCLNGKERGKGRKKGGKPINNVVQLQNPMVLGKETFTELPKIKCRVRNILNVYKNDEKIKSPDHEFISDLLKVFNKKEEKAHEINHFVIAPHKRQGYYRTFFSVYNDGTKDEFSIEKCLEKIALSNVANRRRR